jgi:TonB-linked SusC/RagA family outer membrane protein
MEEETIGLEEVVAVGYGTMKKSDLTGSLTSVKSDNINAFPTTNVLQALSGRAAGVQVMQNSGEPGGSINIRIRGTNSIRGSNEPLYVIDGFPMSGSNPTIINNLDIESIEILKDASATSIYGSRGANGVVLITTKQGKAGATQVHYESNFGIQSLIKKMEMMNGSEYAEFYNRVAVNDNWDPPFTQAEIDAFGEGYDWQDYVFQNGLIHNHDIVVSGGNEKTKFSFSGSLFDENGIIKKSGYERYSVRSNIMHNISDKLRISSNITLSKLKKDNQSSSGGGRGTSLISGSLYPFPTVTPYNEDGSIRDLKTIYHWSPEINNPALYLDMTQSMDQSDKVLANAAFEYEPIENLIFRIMGGIENTNDRSDYYRNKDYIGAEAYASASASQFRSLLNENTVSYLKTIGKHTISGLAGFTFQDFLSTSLSGSGTGFLSDVQESYNLGAAAVAGIPGSGHSYSVILSGLGRLNYNYDNKYLLTVNFRADGSSKYSPGNKWGYFPSGALAWRVSNENFFGDLSDIISDMKVRVGWGTTGSQAIGAYATLNNLYSGKTVFGGIYHTTFAPSTNLPGDLKWETTEQTNIGVDVGFLENRFRLTADYYFKRTRDLLNTVTLPPSGGFRTTIDNVGAIDNNGLEFEVNADILPGPFKWFVDANISFNRNKVKKLYKGQDILGSRYNVTLIDDHINILREGEPLGVFYGYLEDGYDETGRLKYKNLNNDEEINVRDKVIIGDPNPDFIYGFNSTWSYKNFDFTIFIQGVQGNDIFNLAGLNNTLDVGFGGNMPKDVFYNHWTPDNKDAKYPIPSRTNQVRVSDRQVEDGSYLRFRNIQLAYNIPFEKLGLTTIKNVQVYVGGKNLITITDYSRWDPEVNSYGGSSSINQGIDHHTYPVNKSINFGIRADF